jgi:hypothetical protein
MTFIRLAFSMFLFRAAVLVLLRCLIGSLLWQTQKKENTLSIALTHFTNRSSRTVRTKQFHLRLQSFKPQWQLCHIPECLDESVSAKESATFHRSFSPVFPVATAMSEISL